MLGEVYVSMICEEGDEPPHYKKMSQLWKLRKQEVVTTERKGNKTGKKNKIYDTKL